MRNYYEVLIQKKEEVINELKTFGCSEREAIDIAVNAMRCAINMRSEMDLLASTSNYNIKAVIYAYIEFDKLISQP